MMIYECVLGKLPSESKLAFDGTLIITVDDYSKVNRVIVKDKSHFGCVFEPVYDDDEEVDWYDRRDDERWNDD